MWDKARQILDKYFTILKEKLGEDVGIIYGMYEEKGKIEVDAIVGDESEKVLGLRFFYALDQIIFDLLISPEEFTEEIKGLDKKKKKKKVGKKAFSCHYKSDNLPIDHDFVFYTKNGKLSKDVKYAEMITTGESGTKIVATFKLDEILFEMQVQA